MEECIVWLKTNSKTCGLAQEMALLCSPPSQIRSGSENFNQIKVPRNDGTNFADYLLSGVDITCIVVDGANRKWFGTNGNGVYLISADNLQELKHFTAENSPLLSNTIESMVINNNTGEVFFGTTEGLCSYVTDATDAPKHLKR